MNEEILIERLRKDNMVKTCIECKKEFFCQPDSAPLCDTCFYEQLEKECPCKK